MTRIAVSEKQHWSDPIIALSSEEIPFVESTVTGERLAAGIRWQLNERDYQRVCAGLGCMQCLTPFPVEPNLRNIKVWRDLTSTEWRWPDPGRDHGLALVALGCCPICGYESSPEMMEIQDEGVQKNLTDEDWNEQVGGFDERANAYFEAEERKQRSTGFKPKGGFLTKGRPVK